MPSRPFSKVLKRDNDSTSNLSSSDHNPMGSSSRSDDTHHDGEARAIDRLMDKVRGKSESHDGGSNNNGNGGSRRSSMDSNRLTKIISGSRLRRNRGDKLPSENGSTVELSLEHSEMELGDSSNHVESPVGRTESVHTEDSFEAGSAAPKRPPLSPHHSHTGLLTLSSPAVSRASVTALPSEELVEEKEHTLVEKPRIEKLASSQTSLQAGSLGAPVSRQRSVSPARKLKEAFTSSRHSSPGKDPDADEHASGGGLGIFSGRGRASAKDLPPVSTGVSPSTAGERRASGVYSDQPDLLLRTVTAPARQSIEVPRTAIRNSDGAPSTLVTPPTPTLEQPPSSSQSDDGLAREAPVNRTQTEPVHRRTKSAGKPSSKLSQALPPPLTPTAEELKTPGGTITAPTATTAGGFFSSVFSVTQNAANQLSNSFGGKSTRALQRPTSSEGSTEAPGSTEQPAALSESVTAERKPLAVETLGKGNLSLSHLGISEDSGSMASLSNGVTTNGSLHNTHHADAADAKHEDAHAARAVSAAYAEPHPTIEKDNLSSVSLNSDAQHSQASRPRSFVGHPDGTSTPPRSAAATLDSDLGVKRSGSVRSKLSGRKNRRKRGSSAGTGTTISTALGAATAAMVNPGSTNAQRPTGFAVASSKRNRDFHQLFRSVPEDDYLIEDYSAALSREILLQGRFYVSEGHVCFSSNILGWVTNLVINFDEIVSVEKKNTAGIFPNAIVVQTLHARNVFASFMQRDSTYDLLIGIWKISHPNLKSSVNGVMLDDAGTGDKTEKAESIDTEGSLDDSDEEVYDEDAEDDEMEDGTEAHEGSGGGSEVGERAPLSRKTSTVVAAPTEKNISPQKVMAESEPAAASTGAGGNDFPGPATHAPTECTDAANHYERPLIDIVIPAPLGKVYSLMFGPASVAFMKKWLLDEKNWDLVWPDPPGADKPFLSDENRSLTFSYMKPLNAPVGPKQTKCIISCTLDHIDLERSVSVSCSTATPDVPSGNAFTTKTRYCLMWAPGNSTRVVLNFTVAWTGKSWLKGPIEKGCQDGQSQYAKDITAAVKAAVTAGKAKPAGAAGGKGKGKGKRKKDDDADAEMAAPKPPPKVEASWGPLQPLKPILGPIGDLLSPYFSTRVFMGVLLALLMYNSFFKQSAASSGHLIPGIPSARRMAAYEQVWRQEENELWLWLEERMGVHDLPHGSSLRTQHSPTKPRGAGLKRQLNAMKDKLVEETIGQREMDEAIRVTEEKLHTLKEALHHHKKEEAAALSREEGEAAAK